MRSQQARLVHMSLTCDASHDVYAKRVTPGGLSGLEAVEFSVTSARQRFLDMPIRNDKVVADLDDALVRLRSIIGLSDRAL